MAKSNGRTQRPQRTSRNSSTANIETKAQSNEDVEAVEDPTTETAKDLQDESLEGDLLDLDGSADKADVVADDADVAEDADAAETEDQAGADSTAATEKKPVTADKKSTSKKPDSVKSNETDVDVDETDASDADDEETDDEETDKSAKSDKAAKSDKSSKSGTAKGAAAKSSTAKDSSAKGPSAKGSSAKRTSRSGNPAKRPQGRKTATYTSQSGQQTIKPNPSWFLPVLIALLLVGLIWLVAFYVSQGAFPVEAWGNWNILIGFGFFVAGLIMSTRWR